MENKKIIRDLNKFIVKNYGKKCKDYDPFCIKCTMWHAFNTIKEGAKW